MYLKAFFTQDMSQIETDERFIGLFYKQPEPTGNDVPEVLEKQWRAIQYQRRYPIKKVCWNQKENQSEKK